MIAALVEEDTQVPQAFVISQIGNEQLNRLCTDVLFPAIVACGLEPRRVDRHNQGGLLKSEIIKFIQESAILIADLTNERPNVYLEIGYAMGIEKFRNLILTVREDHFPDSPNHQRGGPKVHFDLAGYDILSWDPNDLSPFRAELERRIRRRLVLVTPAKGTTVPVWDDAWLMEQFMAAVPALERLAHPGRMLIRAALHPPKISRSQRELLA